MRVVYLRAALERDTARYDVHDTAALPTRMATEVQKVQDAIGPKLGLVVVPLGQFVTGLAVGFYFGWKLCLVIVCVLPAAAERLGGRDGRGRDRGREPDVVQPRGRGRRVC